MRTGNRDAGDGSGAKAPRRWRISPPQVLSVRAGPAAAPASANRPSLLPAGSRLPPPPPGRIQVDLWVGKEGQGAEDGPWEEPRFLAEVEAWQSQG